VYLVDTMLSTQGLLKARRYKLTSSIGAMRMFLQIILGDLLVATSLFCVHIMQQSGESSAEGRGAALNPHRQCVVFVYA
jgi:hypothetical protein